MHRRSSYLRPETAGGIFVNFKNIIDSFHPKLPFGIAQIGKAFRNEIAPRDFVFRIREFEQMEIEYFVSPDDWEACVRRVAAQAVACLERALGLREAACTSSRSPTATARITPNARSISSSISRSAAKSSTASRIAPTSISPHTAQASGQDLTYLDDQTGERFMPHVIEPSFGVDRTILAILASAYTRRRARR